MLLALTTSSGSRSALPHVRRTLPQAELLHAAIVRRAGNGQRVSCPEVTGRDARKGKRSRMATSTPISSPWTWTAISISTTSSSMPRWGLASLRNGQSAVSNGPGPKEALGICSWRLPELAAWMICAASLHRSTTAVEGLLGPQRGARAWSSASPFVPPRYLKARGKNSLAAQVRAELASRGLATQVAVAVLPWSGASLPLRHFVRRRARGGLPPPMDVGFALQLHFDEPIAGPIVLGYGCHFGLGLFAAES
ncbi:MAG: type I-G CRISPR-associated protein Csb2 [Thermoguttaceae bacterium]